MDFQRQCRRFLNYRVLNEESFKKKFECITAISVFKTTVKGTVVNRFVIADIKDRAIYIINEADGQILKQYQTKTWETYGLCCTNKTQNNFIYVTDITNHKIHKFDENLTHIKEFKTPEESTQLNYPCGITINNEFDRIDVIDQKNHRVVSFDLKTEEYVSELPLYRDVFVKKVKKPHVEQLLKNDFKQEEGNYYYASKKLINCWPFGIYSKNERIFITDWARDFVFVYKNGRLENRIGGHKLFSRIRDILIDSLDSILVTDTYRRSVFIFDNKGVFIQETKLPISTDKVNGEEESVFGVCKIDNSKFVYATHSSIVICNLS